MKNLRLVVAGAVVAVLAIVVAIINKFIYYEVE